MIRETFVVQSSRNFFRELFRKRQLIFDLAVRNFTATYHGSALGLFWAFIEPLIYMAVTYVVVSRGLRYAPSGEVPYVPWLMCAMITWFFFTGVVQSSSTVFLNHAYLLKKWDFNMSILPVVTILSQLFVHGVFLLLLLGLFVLTHIPFSIYWFQFLYYIFALSIFAVGLSWITASLSLFLKDIRNVISVVIQLGFWVSPIFWEIKTFPPRYWKFLKLNPMYYVMTGYRNSFLYHVPFWSDMKLTTYYWVFTLVVLSLGLIVYKKLRPHFGDVI